MLVALPACPGPDNPDPDPIEEHGIGTWPTPEMQNPVGAEECDGVDNDGDGSIDEGCTCTGERACIMVGDRE